MRIKISNLRSFKFLQATALAIAGSSLAGCSADLGRFGEMPYAPSTANQQAIIGGPQQPLPPPVDQTGSIQPGYSTSPLPPPPTQPAYASQQPNYAPQPPAPVYAPPRAAEPTYPAAPAHPLRPPVAAQTTAPRLVATPTQPIPPGPRKTVVATATPPQNLATVSAPPAAGPGPAGWTSAGGTYVPLRQGETIATLSQRYGVPVSAIMAANNFADATRVQPGQQVLIPTYVYSNATAPKAPAPVAAAPVAPAAKLVPPAPKQAAIVPPAAPVALAQGGEHVVKKGETLDSISRIYGIPKDKIRVANRIKDPSAPLKPGQKIAIPLIGGQHIAQTKVNVPTVTAKTPTVVVQAPPATPAPIRTAEAKPVDIKQAAPVATDAKPVSAAVAVEDRSPVDSARSEVKATAPSFRWPVRGRVIADFGTKPGGDRNDGINLAVPEGTSVKSAEDGVVVYSGNELKGYGNVVLVKHTDGWVTVYAHASDLLVNKGDKVTRGQIIARAGATGSVTQPQLHFELRKGQKPVDPKGYLAN